MLNAVRLLPRLQAGVKPFILGLPLGRAGLYLKRSSQLGACNAHRHLVSEPSPWACACRSLAADYPIPDVVTIPEVITLATRDFHHELGSLGSKELPAIRRCCHAARLTQGTACNETGLNDALPTSRSFRRD